MAESSYYGQQQQQQNAPAAAAAAASGSIPRASQALDQGKIFVGGLSWQTTEESLRWHFEQYGPVLSVEVMRDRVTGDPRGFAFVVFQSQETVDLVMAEAKHEINHKVVDVKRAQARGVAPPSIHESKQRPSGPGGGGTPTAAGGATDPAMGGAISNANENVISGMYDVNNNNALLAPNNTGGGGGGGSGGGSINGTTTGGGTTSARQKLTPEQQGNKVFVGGIPHHIDRDELKHIFEQFGAVVDSIVMMDQVQRRSRGFGFITFEDGSHGAQKAIDAQPLNIQGRLVEVKLATPKADQKRFPPAAGPKNVGLRAGMISSSSMSSSSLSGEYAGLAVSYGRSGWRAGYGTKAFGAGGWNVQGWEDGGPAPEKTGFAFDMLKSSSSTTTIKRDVRDVDYQHHHHHHELPPASKRTRY